MAPSHSPSQRGTFIVEFAIIFLVLLVFLFGIIELARIMYLYNTLADATRRAAATAAVTDYRDTAAMRLVRQQAIFRSDPGELLLGAPVTDQHILIDYLALVRNLDNTLTLTPIPTASLPSCPARNRVTCTGNPNDALCIRFVRARICDPASANGCTAVNSTSLFGLLPPLGKLPVSTTIVTAETLGYIPGAMPCP